MPQLDGASAVVRTRPLRHSCSSRLYHSASSHTSIALFEVLKISSFSPGTQTPVLAARLLSIPPLASKLLGCMYQATIVSPSSLCLGILSSASCLVGYGRVGDFAGNRYC